MTPAGTSDELDVQNGWEENTPTHTHTVCTLNVRNNNFSLNKHFPLCGMLRRRSRCVQIFLYYACGDPCRVKFRFLQTPCGCPCRVCKILARWSMGSRLLAYIYFFLWSFLAQDSRGANLQPGRKGILLTNSAVFLLLVRDHQ